MKSATKKKVCIVRIDALGDLIVTLPIQDIFQQWNQSPSNPYQIETHWLINSGLAPVAKLYSAQLKVTEVPRASSWQRFLFLLYFFKNHDFDLILIIYAPWWVALAAKIASSAHVVGRKSQWWSYLFLSNSLRQSRSSSQKHELEYNWELTLFALNQLNQIGPSLDDPPPKPEYLSAWSLNSHPSLLSRFSLQPKKFLVVHPGMKGSAANLSPDQYSQLIELLLERNHLIVITGTKIDEPWLMPLASRWKNHPSLVWLVDQLNLEELAYVLSQARCVIAPSTGVAHLAAVSGTPVIALYPPNTRQSPKRWRPLGNMVTIIMLPQNTDEPFNLTTIVDHVDKITP